MKTLLRTILSFIFSVEIHGKEHLDALGKRSVMVANHSSFLDALLIGVFLPHKPVFAVNTHIAARWWMKPFLLIAKTYPLDPTNPMATKGLIDAIKQDCHCVIFPEGRITLTGSLMKVYEGPGMIADKSEAPIIPIRIDGAQYSRFSKLKGKVRLRLFPKITLTILSPVEFDIADDIQGRKRREIAGQKLYDLMSDMMFTSSFQHKTLFEGLLDASHTHGRKHKIIEDPERNPLSYGTFLTKSFVLSRVLSRTLDSSPNIGLMLPSSSGAVISFFALQAIGKTVGMLNFSTGEKNLLSAIHTGEITQIITSKRFIEMAKLDNIIKSLEEESIAIVYLEDLRPDITLKDKILGTFASYFPQSFYTTRSPEQPAVILFTSGSEGVPKGVVLSHNNIIANIHQLGSRIDFGPADIVFNILPIFHSFGLTGGTLLPILSGIKTFFYPSPLHYRIIPELIYDTNATIMFGTDTFLTNYARFAHPYDFYSLRYVFAGAEKLQEETRKVWSEKYGVRIFEAYGATETSPGLTTNTPMHNKAGTVGRLLPGIETRIEPVPGIDDGGRLYVKGPNIMHGYFLSDNPGELQPPADGWYDTGDIVSIDEYGYVSIKGRAKRFAKIAGEMVSLTAVETYLHELWPDHMHAVVSLPDAKKGEQLILLTDHPKATRTPIVTYAQKHGISELAIPKKILKLDEIPVLGTGKIDYVTAKAYAEQEVL